MDAGVSLSKISAAKKALAQASSLDQVLSIRDQAEAIRVYLKASRESLDVQNAAADIKIRAERKVGELLREMEKNPGGGDRSTGNGVLPVPSLQDLGITKMQSSRWQLAASLPEESYCALLESCNATGREFTQSLVLLTARKATAGGSADIEPVNPKLDLLDLVADVRTTVARWANEFGQHRLDTLINVLKSELAAMEVPQ